MVRPAVVPEAAHPVAAEVLGEELLVEASREEVVAEVVEALVVDSRQSLSCLLSYYGVWGNWELAGTVCSSSIVHTRKMFAILMNDHL